VFQIFSAEICIIVGRHRPKFSVYSLRLIAGLFRVSRLSVNPARRHDSSEIFKTFSTTAPLESSGVENRLILQGEKWFFTGFLAADGRKSRSELLVT